MITAPEIVEAIPIILSLIVIEGLLSVDNALAIAALASHLPGKQKYIALKLGIIGAYVFRGIALLFASWIIANQWVKLLGAMYLIYLMCSHLRSTTENTEGSLSTGTKPGLFMTIVQIEVMDLSLSIDNVVAAVVMSPKLWVVCTGVFIGILALRFVAGACIRLLQKYPILASTAFLLVGYVGLLLIVEMFLHVDLHSSHKFVGIVLIIALTIIYSRYESARRLMDPVAALVRPVMAAFAFMVDLLFWPVTRLLHWAVGRFKPATDTAP